MHVIEIPGPFSVEENTLHLPVLVQSNTMLSETYADNCNQALRNSTSLLKYINYTSINSQ